MEAQVALSSAHATSGCCGLVAVGGMKELQGENQETGVGSCAKGVNRLDDSDGFVKKARDERLT